MSALIETDQLGKTYRSGGEDLAALAGVSLRIAAGEFVAVVGPSGSGKSTLLSLLGCLERPSSGRYRFAGRDTAALDANALAQLRNRHIGFVFQHFNLLPRSDALSNVELPLLYAGVPRRERRERARQQLTALGLGERLQHHPNQLSGGQQQRVAIARALVTRPNLVLADEPTGALDSRTGAEVMALLAAVHAAGTSVVLVTHDLSLAAQAQRQLYFHDGRLTRDSSDSAPARAAA
jgi:putative ABC transport system ATP-binding protein